jgi:hypothetical protein
MQYLLVGRGPGPDVGCTASDLKKTTTPASMARAMTNWATVKSLAEASAFGWSGRVFPFSTLNGPEAGEDEGGVAACQQHRERKEQDRE